MYDEDPGEIDFASSELKVIFTYFFIQTDHWPSYNGSEVSEMTTEPACQTNGPKCLTFQYTN